MGYQFVFWQQARGTPEAPEVYRLLGDEQSVPGLAALPLAAICEALTDAFPGLKIDRTEHPSGPVYWEDEGVTSVEFWWSAVHVAAELRPFGDFAHDVANRIIDVLADFGCPLYDPQTGERFDSDFDT